jgi:hypothetical protein
MQTRLTGLVLGIAAASAFPSITSSSRSKQADIFQPRGSTYLHDFLGSPKLTHCKRLYFVETPPLVLLRVLALLSDDGSAFSH